MLGEPQRDAHELAQQVSLLVGERAAAERRQRRWTVRLAQPDELVGDEVERRFPRRRRQPPVARAHQRRGETRRVIQEIARREPLDAHLAAVDRERRVGPDVGPRRGHRLGGGHRGDCHPALKRAVGTVRPGGDGVDHPQRRVRERLGTCCAGHRLGCLRPGSIVPTRCFARVSCRRCFGKSYISRRRGRRDARRATTRARSPPLPNPPPQTGGRGSEGRRRPTVYLHFREGSATPRRKC